MKNSKQYTEALDKFWSSHKKAAAKSKLAEYEENAETLVAGVLFEFLTSSQSVSAMKKMAKHFVDWNDLRVSRAEEILEVLGDAKSEDYISAANALTGTLGAVFERYDSINLESLEEPGKRQAKQELDEIEYLSPYVVNYVMMHIKEGHCIPVSNRMADFLKDNKLVHPDSTLADITSFLERHIPAADGMFFYIYMRQLSETEKKKATKKTTAKKKTAKKTVAKKAAAKKTTSKKTVTKKKTTKKVTKK